VIRAAAIALLLAASPVAAGQPATAAAISAEDKAERLAVAEELIADSGMADILDKMTPAIIAQVLPALTSANNGRESEVRAILLDELTSAMKKASPAIIENARSLYVESFTAGEMREMLAFNRSPTGRKVMKVLPDMQLRMMSFGRDAGQAAVAAALPRIIDRLKAANLSVPTTS
jgi:hypothetical protein